MPAGRPADAGRRERTLAAVVDYAGTHGLDDVSLRPLAAALGTSPRMLLYDFGSKDELVAAVLDSVRAQQASAVADAYRGGRTPQAAVRALWTWLTAPEHAGYVRLYAQARLRDAGRSDQREGAPSVDGLRVEQETGATHEGRILVVTLLHALALRRLGDLGPGPADRAFEHFIAGLRG